MVSAGQFNCLQSLFSLIRDPSSETRARETEKPTTRVTEGARRKLPPWFLASRSLPSLNLKKKRGYSLQSIVELCESTTKRQFAWKTIPHNIVSQIRKLLLSQFLLIFQEEVTSCVLQTASNPFFTVRL